MSEVFDPAALNEFAEIVARAKADRASGRRAVYRVFITRDDVPVFQGRVGEDDEMYWEQLGNSPVRVKLTATGEEAFLERV